MRLSMLDQSPIISGHTAADAIAATLDLAQAGWNADKSEDAARLFEKLCPDHGFVEFLTLRADESID